VGERKGNGKEVRIHKLSVGKALGGMRFAFERDYEQKKPAADILDILDILDIFAGGQT
jgi:hypothetical protein